MTLLPETLPSIAIDAVAAVFLSASNVAVLWSFRHLCRYPVNEGPDVDGGFL